MESSHRFFHRSMRTPRRSGARLQMETHFGTWNQGSCCREPIFRVARQPRLRVRGGRKNLGEAHTRDALIGRARNVIGEIFLDT